MRQNQRRIRRAVLGLCFLALLASLPWEGRAEPDFSAPAAPAGQDLARDDSAYVIGPENFIQIRILGENDTQQTFRVDDSGYITHPLVGRVKLAGMTVAEAERVMEDALGRGYILHPNVTILVVEHSRFSILGEVRNPGHYEILGQLRLVDAISMAGGFTPVANEKKVKIIRKGFNGEEKMEVNVQDVMQGKKQDDTFIQAGDVINVSKSFF